MTEVMLDIETLGRTPGCVILSIGAVTFTRKTGEIHSHFYRNIDSVDAVDRGFHTEADTVEWWGKQSPEAWASLQTDVKTVPEAIKAFREWFLRQKGKEVWCQGMNFDEPILNASFQKVGVPVPWRFYNVRDTRTAYDVLGFDPWSNEIKREGVYHNAIDDCKHQVKLLKMAYDKIDR